MEKILPILFAFVIG